MTLNGIMAVILRHSTKFGSFGDNYVEVVKERPIPYCLRQCSQKNLVLTIRDLWQYSQRLPRTNALREAPLVKGDNLTNIAR